MIDKRELPAFLPASIREATEASRMLPLSHTTFPLTEGLLIDQILGYGGAVPQLRSFHHVEALHDVVGHSAGVQALCPGPFPVNRRVGQRIAIPPQIRLINTTRMQTP